MKIVDLFCGAGGFTLGAHLAGFHTALAVDKDDVLTSSFTTNFPLTKLSLQDLTHTSGEALLMAAGVMSNEEVGIIGGPPCQGFSLMGKRSLSDPRNELLEHFFRLVMEIRPRFFVMENVPGLLLGGARPILDAAITKMTGYGIVGPLKLNARHYGAATNRERVVVIGFRGDSLLTEEDIIGAQVKRRPTVADAIRDLPSPTRTGKGFYRSEANLSTYAARARETRLNLGSDAARSHLKAGEVTGVFSTEHTTDVVARFGSVSPGKSDIVSRCPRLAWHLAAPTLRAGTGPDHGSFQSVRPLHPSEHRVITVREAARLQGFPDWFTFHRTKWHSFRMIGNSVSPPMSTAIMKLINQALKTVRDGN